MDALVRMSGSAGASSALGPQALAGPAEHSQIISIGSPSSSPSGIGENGSADARSPPHAAAAVNGATVYVGALPLPEVPAAASREQQLCTGLANRHVVKIRIEPSGQPIAPKLVSAVRLSLDDEVQADDGNGCSAGHVDNDTCVRISVGSSVSLASHHSGGSESSSEELAMLPHQPRIHPQQQQQQQQQQSCFFYSSPPGSMLMSSGQCSPSETLDSGTCSDLDGTPPPLPKKKAAGTVLLECGQASLSDCKSMLGAAQQHQQKQQSLSHNRTGSLTSSGAEVDSSDENDSSLSCDSLNSAELELRVAHFHEEERPLVSECTYEERHRDDQQLISHEREPQKQQQQKRYLYEDDCHYKFHVNEREEVGRAELASVGSVASTATAHNEDECFAGYKILEREAIRSAKGTVRGVKNRVRAGIATFLENPSAKNYKTKDAGKVVVYTTTMGIVRETYYRCVLVKQILRTHMVKYEERDMYMSSELQTELRERLGYDAIEVPQLFIDGQHIGDADKVERLNETGELRLMLKPYKSLNACSTCKSCGGYRLLPCPICNGSKKSVHRNHFTTEFIALKCMNCDEVGLVRCQQC